MSVALLAVPRTREIPGPWPWVWLPMTPFARITCPLDQRLPSLTKNATRLAMSAATPAPANSSATYRQPVHASSANATSSRPANRASQARSCAQSAGAIWPRFTSPVAVSR